MIDLEPPQDLRVTPHRAGILLVGLLMEFVVSVSIAGALYGFSTFPMSDDLVAKMNHADWVREGRRHFLNLAPFSAIWFGLMYPVNLALIGPGGGRKALVISALMSLIIILGISLGVIEFVRTKPFM